MLASRRDQAGASGPTYVWYPDSVCVTAEFGVAAFLFGSIRMCWRLEQ